MVHSLQPGLVVQDVNVTLGDVTGPRVRRNGATSAGREKRSEAARGSLGTHDGKAFTSPPERTAQERADALDWDTGELVYSDEKRRLARWEMQSAARGLLDHARLNQCYRVPVDEVRVYRRPTTATYYRGLRVCGMVWGCAVCAAKVAERRRVELVTAMDAHRAEGGTVLLMTLTAPHTREDEPFSLLGRLLRAFVAFGQGKRAWTALLPGVVGSVRALEVTHGEANGWHPHLHVLVFLAGKVDPAEYVPVLLAQWGKVVTRHGLGEVNEHGLRLDDGEKAAKYASKWGLEDEMTKAHIKQGRKGGNRTPWALLADYVAGDKRAGALFRQFFDAFRGRHQLRWSRGLRKRFGLDEKTDEELAAEKVEALDVLAARLTLEEWKLIRKHDLRGVVLELLRVADRPAVVMLLDHYRARGAAPGMVATKARKGTTPEESQTGPGRERVALSDGSAGPVPSLRRGSRTGTAGERPEGAPPKREIQDCRRRGPRAAQGAEDV